MARRDGKCSSPGGLRRGPPNGGCVHKVTKPNSRSAGDRLLSLAGKVAHVAEEPGLDLAPHGLGPVELGPVPSSPEQPGALRSDVIPPPAVSLEQPDPHPIPRARRGEPALGHELVGGTSHPKG